MIRYLRHAKDLECRVAWEVDTIPVTVFPGVVSGDDTVSCKLVSGALQMNLRGRFSLRADFAYTNELDMMFVEQVFVQAVSPNSAPVHYRHPDFIIAAKFGSARHFRLLRDVPVFCDFGPAYRNGASLPPAILLDYESVIGGAFTTVAGRGAMLFMFTFWLKIFYPHFGK